MMLVSLSLSLFCVGHIRVGDIPGAMASARRGCEWDGFVEKKGTAADNTTQ